MEKGRREGLRNEEGRRASVGNVEDFLRKRRREEKEGVEREEDRIFSRSKKTQRSPKGRSGGDAEGEGEEWVKNGEREGGGRGGRRT